MLEVLIFLPTGSSFNLHNKGRFTFALNVTANDRSLAMLKLLNTHTVVSIVYKNYTDIGKGKKKLSCLCAHHQGI